MNKRAFSTYVSFVLKVVGAIVIVSSVIDYIILAVPFQPLNPDWQIAFTSQIVDRGIVPMVGIAFLISGYWLQEYRMGKTQRVSLEDLRLWMLIFSSVMGLIFFLLVPLHLSNLSLVRGREIAQIEERFDVEEQRIQTQADQFRQLIEEGERLSSPFWNGQASGSRLEQLKQIRKQLEQWIENPEIFEQQYNETMTQLGDRRQEAENQAKTNVLKSGFRIGANSLLLAIGYTIIGWTGLRGLTGGGSLPLSRQVRAR
ncbi:MAG: HpsJ family protein [Cyanobacteria bacterium SBLK]|nr:HpsJ family protein [Cyanobacteria bacterium SBLK]